MLSFRYRLHNLLCYFNTLGFFSPSLSLSFCFCELLCILAKPYISICCVGNIFLSIFFGRELLAHDTALRAINWSCDTDVHCLCNLSHIKQLP